MRYDHALSHTISVLSPETFRSLFALTMPLVRSYSWDSQLAVPNNPDILNWSQIWRSGRTRKGSNPAAQFPRVWHHSQRRRRCVGVKDCPLNEHRDPKSPSASCFCIVQEDTRSPSEGATRPWMTADGAVKPALLRMIRSSRRLFCRRRPEPDLRVNSIF
ncbi:hypothetical protein TNCV_4756001 [Trichonephila clavipes]|nr:hypothetical protein TNCV_4756001 [Trichonephila clavipes]